MSGGRWIENSLVLSFLAWLFTTILWAVFTAMKIPGPALDQIWLLVSGAFVANVQIVVKKTRKEKESPHDDDSLYTA